MFDRMAKRKAKNPKVPDSRPISVQVEMENWLKPLLVLGPVCGVTPFPKIGCCIHSFKLSRRLVKRIDSLEFSIWMSGGETVFEVSRLDFMWSEMGVAELVFKGSDLDFIVSEIDVAVLVLRGTGLGFI
jgi:hypothetical protein